MKQKKGKVAVVVSLMIVLGFVILVSVILPAMGTGRYNHAGLVDSLGQTVEPGQKHTAQNGWVTLATVASAGEEPNDLAVGERTYATVSAAAEGGDSKIVIYGDSYAERQEMLSANVMRIRATGITDAGNIIWGVYVGTLEVGDTDCALAYAGQLDFTVGTQASVTATYEFADTLSVTAGETVKGFVSSSPTSNRVAEADINLDGANILVLVPTTAGCNGQLLGKGR